MTNETEEITNTEDYLDIQDIISRVESLQDTESSDSELAHLQLLLSECAGNGGDHEYNGEWYPALLIRESYFETYAQEMAEDIGAIDANASWPLQHIDWNAAANELLMDYTSCEFDRVTYYYR